METENGSNLRGSSVLAVLIKMRQRANQWEKLQSRARVTVFFAVQQAIAVAVAWTIAVWLPKTHPQHPVFDATVYAIGVVAWIILWPLIALRWKSLKS